jgi:SagB-type dehydrogenase family enzyme
VPATSGRFTFLGSALDDPRRIQLRTPEVVEAYHQRDTSTDLVELAHGLTKLAPADMSKALGALTLFARPSMQAVQHVRNREYPLAPICDLPVVRPQTSALHRLLSQRRSQRCFGGDMLPDSQLSSLFFAANGETGRMETAEGDEGGKLIASLRSIPSAGALHPTGVFVALLRAETFDPAIYHYDPTEHALERLGSIGEHELGRLLEAFPIHPAVVDLSTASAIFFITSTFWRLRAKYGPRGYRYCLFEAGCACQNLSLMAVELGLAHVVLGGFYDDAVHEFLEVDGVDQAVIAAVAAGSLPCELDEAVSHGKR